MLQVEHLHRRGTPVYVLAFDAIGLQDGDVGLGEDADLHEVWVDEQQVDEGV